MDQDTTSALRVELARAKIDLALHITGQRADGFHLLNSLAVFPQIGDRVALEPSCKLEFELDGPFARDLHGFRDDNPILKTINAFAAVAGVPTPNVRLTLTKRLPVASGVAGRSSDAATLLRLLEDFTGVYLSEEKLHRLALSLGTNVPVCLFPEPQIMRGIGDDISPGPVLPSCGIVLVNPKLEIPVSAVFENLNHPENPEMPTMPDRFETLEDLTAYLSNCRNDLQETAGGMFKEINEVLRVLEADHRVALVRMSGTGATCFGLCELRQSLDIERDLRNAHPQWWIASGALS